MKITLLLLFVVVFSGTASATAVDYFDEAQLDPFNTLSDVGHDSPLMMSSASGRKLHATVLVDCTNPLACNLHGNCDAGTGCTCYQDTQNGYWVGATCTDCSEGYAGDNCTIECPGGRCNLCSGHGACNSGRKGDGTCTCIKTPTDGYWTGKDCNMCVENYFGSTCKRLCPGFVPGGDPKLICSGRGTCDYGALGSGTCTCNPGFGSATNCVDCDDSHYGSDCVAQCVGYVNKMACSGHGTCFSGKVGNGTCVCHTGYSGYNCSTQCPGSTSTVLCGGHGKCFDGLRGNGTCACEANWAAPSCATCVVDRIGPNCTTVCPKDYMGVICSANGACYYDNGEAKCKCDAGYSGRLCHIKCGGDPPCSGHGNCSETSKSCDCVSTNADGHWSGNLCNVCEYGWSGDECKTACPMGTTAETKKLVCSGHGQCMDGVCLCNSTDPSQANYHCGASCQFSGATECKDVNKCHAAYLYGPLCGDCPARRLKSLSTTDGAASYKYVACSEIGTCHDTTLGSGRCYCDSVHTGY
eukprot:PhM_4_TR16808/c0_g1_i2/m.52172